MNKKAQVTKAGVAELIRQWDGKLTAQTKLEGAPFGLGRVPARLQPTATTTAICGFCSTGCGLRMHLRDGEAVNLSADGDYPVNVGAACPKGWEALTPLEAPDRGTTPLVAHNGGFREVDWHQAMTIFCERMKAVQAEHGAESVAFLSTGQIPTEEMALLGAVAKFGIGMKHGDGNTRQCMATAVTAYKESFGFDAPPYSYKDFEESDVLVFVGANPCVAHPIMWERVAMNKRDPAIIVVDPRQTDTAIAATHHLPLQPKSDLALFYGLAAYLLEHELIDRAFIEKSTSGFAEFARFLEDWPLSRAAEESGLAIELLEEVAQLLGSGKRVSFWWTMGVNQGHEATRVAQSLINLALMTGNVGKPGTGANSITGQCNAMGSRLFSNTTNLLGGHFFENPEHRAKVAAITGVPEAAIQEECGWAYDQIIEGIATGKIKALWVIATNPAHSWIHSGRLHGLLDKLDFLVVQDMYHSTETAEFADLFLPAAGWGEKEGTFINSERRFGLLKKVRKAPGEALADFQIFRLVAAYWGCGEMFAKWESPEAAFEIMKALSVGQPCEISGIADYQMLDREGGVQWPCVGDESPEQERRLFADGVFFHGDGRARFIFEASRPPAEVPCEDYPLWLLTGRGTSAQWHTQTRTAKSAVLRSLYPNEAYAEIHPDDCERYGLAADGLVWIKSRRGKMQARIRASRHVARGQIFVPMHYRETNTLTYAAFDPYSRQPSYKACAVSLGPG